MRYADDAAARLHRRQVRAVRRGLRGLRVRQRPAELHGADELRRRSLPLDCHRRAGNDMSLCVAMLFVRLMSQCFRVSDDDDAETDVRSGHRRLPVPAEQRRLLVGLARMRRRHLRGESRRRHDDDVDDDAGRRRVQSGVRWCVGLRQ